MIINGTTITPSQRNAALSAMTGEFKRDQVFEALCRANLSWNAVRHATNRLIAFECETGRVRRLPGAKFERVR